MYAPQNCLKCAQTERGKRETMKRQRDDRKKFVYSFIGVKTMTEWNEFIKISAPKTFDKIALLLSLFVIRVHSQYE